MSEAAAAPADPGATIRSKSYRVLLVFAAVIGVLVSFASWCFLELVHWIQTEVYQNLPSGLGFHTVPWWWPLPVLAVAGVLTAVAIVRLPGRGGHIPYEGIKAGTAQPAELPGILLAALATLGLGLVLGPEAPLIALGGGLAIVAVRLVKKDTPDQVMAVLAAVAADPGRRPGRRRPGDRVRPDHPPVSRCRPVLRPGRLQFPDQAGPRPGPVHPGVPAPVQGPGLGHLAGQLPGRPDLPGPVHRRGRGPARRAPAGFSETPAVAVLMAAAAVSILRLPLSATVITLLLTSKAGIATAPLIIVAVVVAYLTIETLSAARGPAPAAAPAAEPQPAAPSHATATANPADSQA